MKAHTNGHIYELTERYLQTCLCTCVHEKYTCNVYRLHVDLLRLAAAYAYASLYTYIYIYIYIYIYTHVSMYVPVFSPDLTFQAPYQSSAAEALYLIPCGGILACWRLFLELENTEALRLRFRVQAPSNVKLSPAHPREGRGFRVCSLPS